ncbi:receptor like protein 7 [Hibiscus trionum]|uniref:Receptor like protein 7 n=1 Tax=Hibiscus trionum TaxID=183268 RepID=A0A9W7H1S0_HIBTR|nr:receptor like protein 7 [Hibiscus trionum]
MRVFLKHFVLRCLIFLILPHFLTQCVSSVQQPCLDSERSVLLQLKESFILNQSASDYSFAYPKVGSWKLEGEVGGDCCSWDGVECDDETGHVIGLDLSSSFLYGSIDSNNTLFQLHHLRKLNLSDNHFNGSGIPSAIGKLSRLTQLDLSFSGFSGQIPYEVLELSKLVILDLSGNDLELRNPSLKSLAKRLINLKHLNLDGVKASSSIPQSLANLSSLTSLSLRDCELHGEFPIEIFQLPNLQFIHAIPASLANLTELTYLSLAANEFGPAQFPIEVFQLPNLQILRASHNTFLEGRLPIFHKNTSLEELELASTAFSGELPESIGNLKSLSLLDVSNCSFFGRIPNSMAKLTRLTQLNLNSNQFSSRIPSWLGNLTQLISLDLYGNKFWGSIPESIFTLINLENLDLTDNLLTGSYKLESFLNLKNLKWLQLSDNNFSLLTTTVMNVTIPSPMFQILTLRSCNLQEFPNFLSGQDELEYLSLSRNKIHGFIPKWIWGLSAKTLEVLFLNGNFLAGLHQPTVVPPWTNLRMLDLRSNKLRGSLPIPPTSIYQYFVSNNLLTGEISPMICNLPSLTVLDASNNSFRGMLPPCLGNLSKSLSVLNIRNNKFRGSIPEACGEGSQLRIEDTFPSWLGRLQELKILILRHNEFSGGIGKPESNEFPELRILDLSFNKFEGGLPSHHFQRWKAMQVVDLSKLNYLEANVSFQAQGPRWILDFSYSMTMTKAGVETEYDKIQDFLVAIDLSSNRFEGGIPDDIQILKAVQFLNLSNNLLSGPIPSSLANLTGLQALDLSQNKLSGEIPQELAQLTFLEFFSVSHNQLVGPIPQGKQFGTFENNSFEGNSGLCGKPLTKECYPEESSPSKKDEGGDSWFEFGWKAIMLGYGSGVVNGLVLGYLFNPWKHKLFVKYFGRMLLNLRRDRRK